MQHSVRSRLRPLRHVVVVTVVALAAVLLAAGTAAAIDVDFEGQGTNADGTCANVTGSGDQQTWHFVLTSPDTGPWSLTANFSSGTQTVQGEQQGMGSVFFFVTTPAGATLDSATATNGTAGSVLTVSDCVLSEAPPPTTAAAPPTTAAAPPTTAAAPGAPTAPAAPARAPAAVAAAPRVTG
jgi:hypothetical protein